MNALTMDDVGYGSVIDVCPSCGAMFADPPSDDEKNWCSKPELHSRES